MLATRLKLEQQTVGQTNAEGNKQLFIVQNLRDAIEENFRTKHSASDYADQLHPTPNSLARITKTHFRKTLADLIADRIVIEAKRELYLTEKTVKEIANFHLTA